MFLRVKNRSLYILITIVITSWLHSGCAETADSGTVAIQHLQPEQIAKAKANADALFAQRQDISRLREAVDLLRKLRDPKKRDYEVEWKYAKYSYFLGRHSNDEEAESAFNSGKDAAKIATNLEPEKPDGHFWYAANLGELCRRNPVAVGLQSVDDVREAMNKVIELQPDYQGANAYDGLAKIELGTRLKGGSAEKAIEYLEKGLLINKENSNLRLHMAEAYRAVHRDADARKQLEIVLKMKLNPEYIPEHNQTVEKARKLLETKF